MLKSLFGELGAPEDPHDRKLGSLEPDRRFAARAMMESVATEVNERGQMIDRHLRDIVVRGSPAQAMRDHFAATRSDVEASIRLITLFDPSRIWASAVVKALSDAGGMPIERLHLRDQETLGTLAMIERTTVVRRFDDSLKVYTADVRAPGRDNTEIPVALMERSHLASIIIGSMQPHAIDDMLGALQSASSDANWRCPAMLFMLPPNAVWIANKIAGIDWPHALHIQVQNEPLTSASSVWNTVLGAWDGVKHLPRWGAAASLPEEPLIPEFPIKVADLERHQAPARPPTPQALAHTHTPGSTMPAASASAGEYLDGVPPVQGFNAAGQGSEAALAAGAMIYSDTADAGLKQATPALDPLRAHTALGRLLATDGVLTCALVDSMSGMSIAQESRPDLRFHVDAAIAASAQVLRAHRLAARTAGLQEPIEEVIVTSGNHQQLIHRVARHPDLYLFVLLDKNTINLALARLKVLEAEKAFS